MTHSVFSQAQQHSPGVTTQGGGRLKRLLVLRRNTLYGALVLFCLLLSWFVFAHPYYPAVRMTVTGTTKSTSSEMVLRWAGKAGWNGYEMHHYQLVPRPAAPGKGFPVVIRRTGKKNAAAIGTNVVIKGVYVDGQRMTAPPKNSKGVALTGEQFFRFEKKKARLRFSCAAKHHLRIEFLAHNRAGKVHIRVGPFRQTLDLYSSWEDNSWSRDSIQAVDFWFTDPGGGFAISRAMPRYPLTGLRLESQAELENVRLHLDLPDGQRIAWGPGRKVNAGWRFALDGFDQQVRRYVHPHRLCFQIVFALFTTWLLMQMVAVVRTIGSLRALFWENKRSVFWVMLLLGFAVHLFWHLAFWPGILSTDSQKIWRAAHIPGMYLGDHPPLNVVLYLYISLFWDHIAAVPLVQNLATSLVCASLFFRCYRWGLPGYWLAGCFVAYLLSVPIGVYSAVLWKDIPFALLLVLLAFRLGDAAFQHKVYGLTLSWRSWCLFGVLTVALAGIRHNGVVYLLVFPLFVLWWGRALLRRHLGVVAGFLVGIALVVFTVSQVREENLTTYLLSRSQSYVRQLQHRFSVSFVQNWPENYLGVLNVRQRKSQWDHVHQCFYWRYNYKFLKNVGWNDVYGFEPRPQSRWQRQVASWATTIYRYSYREPWVYFSWNPYFLLLLLAVLPLLYPWLPMSAVFSGFVFLQAAALVSFDIFNWRYYYFVYVALFFLVPLVITDVQRRRHSVQEQRCG